MLAFTLVKKNFRENDQQITFYTKDHGKIETVARGVKKIVSKNAPALEPFSLLEIEVVPGKNYSYVTKVQVLENFPKIRQNKNKILSAAFALSLLAKILKSGERDTNIFRLIYSYEKYLNKTSEASVLLAAVFTGRVACFLGFTPVFGRCVFCEVKLSKTKYFSVSGGGTVCDKCTNLRKPEVLESTPKAIKKFRSILTTDWKDVNVKALTGEEAVFVKDTIIKYAEYHFGVKISLPQAN